MDFETWVELAQAYLIQRRELFGSQVWASHPERLTRSAAVAGAKTTPQELTAFHEQIRDCRRCGLSASRTNLVFGVGNPKAHLMCVGEAPGRDEDLQGEPFVGAAGRLLDKVLAAIGFERREVYIANVIKCRPPGNRDPEIEEIETCRPYLVQQIEMIRPDVILCLGRIASQTILETTRSVSAMRGRVHSFGGARVIVTYHPAALLRNVQLKRSAWEDVQLARRVYDEVVGDKPPLERR